MTCNIGSLPLSTYYKKLVVVISGTRGTLIGHKTIYLGMSQYSSLSQFTSQIHNFNS